MTYVWTGLVCLLLLLLLTPWRARCSLTLSPRGGWGEAALFWGPFPLPPVPVRISLGDVPALSLELLLPGGSKTVFLAEMQRRRKKHAFMPPIRLESLEGTGRPPPCSRDWDICWQSPLARLFLPGCACGRSPVLK